MSRRRDNAGLPDASELARNDARRLSWWARVCKVARWQTSEAKDHCRHLRRAAALLHGVADAVDRDDALVDQHRQESRRLQRQRVAQRRMRRIRERS